MATTTVHVTDHIAEIVARRREISVLNLSVDPFLHRRMGEDGPVSGPYQPDGEVIDRYAPTTVPAKLAKDIDNALLIPS